MPTYELNVEQMDLLVRRAIERNADTVDRPRSQRQLDRTVQTCYDDGELELASAVLLLMAARVQDRIHEVHQMLMQDAFDHREIPPFGAAPQG